jgi:16S rRNA (uracil1498-N3)-methyltransferase
VTTPLFHADAAALAADPIVLGGAEGHHAARVRRVRPGERVDVTDGRGHVAECVVATVERDVLSLSVVGRREVPAPRPRLVVVQALPKGDRGELAVEMLTEVGVDEVVPWAAGRCVVQWRGDRGARALERWRHHAREAAKQAHRAWLPLVRDLATTDEVAALLKAATLGAVLHESASRSLTSLAFPSDGEVVLVVGPEGGVSDDELANFDAAGAGVCRLGDTVLRTSTAGVAAAAVTFARCGRW